MLILKVYLRNLFKNHIYLMYMSKIGNRCRGRLEGSFFNSYYTEVSVAEGATPSPGLFHFTLDHYFMMLSVKQGSIKYSFLSLWYDST